MAKGIFSQATIWQEFFNNLALHPKQKDLLLHLIKLWEKVPEQRFGQLLFNYTRFGTRAGSPDLCAIKDCFHYADDDLSKDLDKAIQSLKGNKNGTTEI